MYTRARLASYPGLFHECGEGLGTRLVHAITTLFPGLLPPPFIASSPKAGARRGNKIAQLHVEIIELSC